MTRLDLFDVSDGARMALACRIRTAVFVDEQGVPPEEEIDEHDRSDPNAVHALIFDGTGSPVGAGRFYVAEPGTVQIGRMAVLPAARGTGAGRALLDALVAEARRRGYARAHLHAQLHARGFYARAGFYEDGEHLWDAGIEHVPMSLGLA